MSYLIRKIFIILLLVGLFLAFAYAEDTTYTDKKYGFSITYPSDCRTLKNYQGAPLIIFLPKASFNENISVTVSFARAMDRSAEELIDIYFKYSNAVLEKKEVVINNIKYRSIVHLQEKRFWFLKFKIKLYSLITVKGARVYVITYGAIINNYDKYIRQAEQIMQTFRFAE